MGKECSQKVANVKETPSGHRLVDVDISRNTPVSDSRTSGVLNLAAVQNLMQCNLIQNTARFVSGQRNHFARSRRQSEVNHGNPFGEQAIGSCFGCNLREARKQWDWGVGWNEKW